MLVIYDTEGQARLDTILPSIIDYAELRCYRDLQLLNTVAVKTSNATASSRNMTIPTPTGGTFVVLETLNALTPLGSTVDNGTRNPIIRSTKEFINAVYSGVSDVPKYYADLDNSTVIFGPTPDQAYLIEFVGTMRPDSLSVTNATTILTTLFPDLFLAASMIFATGYQQNFGAQASSPDMGTSWETQYKLLLSSAGVEEAMKKAQSQAWSSQVPAAVANPARG